MQAAVPMSERLATFCLQWVCCAFEPLIEGGLLRRRRISRRRSSSGGLGGAARGASAAAVGAAGGAAAAAKPRARAAQRRVQPQRPTLLQRAENAPPQDGEEPSFDVCCALPASAAYVKKPNAGHIGSSPMEDGAFEECWVPSTLALFADTPLPPSLFQGVEESPTNVACRGCMLCREPLFVVVEGGIGAGKSALIQGLQSRHAQDDSVRIVQENVEVWKLPLEELYRVLRERPDPAASAAPLASDVQKRLAAGEATIFESRRAAVRRDAHKTVLAERSLQSSAHVFGAELASRGILPLGDAPGELAWLKREYQLHAAQPGNRPDLIIFLHGDIGEAALRVEKRAARERPFEIGMPRDYLDALQRRYEALYPVDFSLSPPVLHVETTGLSADEVLTLVVRKLEIMSDACKAHSKSTVECSSEKASLGGS
eukprot:TRINITY_DN29023_c0_g2_i1.p1 TRINITY_DN29023_c0_g2~~TRINITY_DN29023_c0_g2_i1.p1  ORF type:complete len:429 (+),score=98.96 TRINITY_DN29023_c0_g2_i1:38-1324(+)